MGIKINSDGSVPSFSSVSGPKPMRHRFVFEDTLDQILARLDVMDKTLARLCISIDELQFSAALRMGTGHED